MLIGLHQILFPHNQKPLLITRMHNRRWRLLLNKYQILELNRHAFSFNLSIWNFQFAITVLYIISIIFACLSWSIMFLIIYGRIKLIVLSIWRLELVGLVRDAAEFIFTLINRALCSSRICIMVSGLLGSKMRGSRYVIADSCILIRTLPNFYTFVQFVGSFYIRIVLAI